MKVLCVPCQQHDYKLLYYSKRSATLVTYLDATVAYLRRFNANCLLTETLMLNSAN